MYTSLRKLDEKGEWRQPKLNLLGVSEKDGGLHEPLERGISAVHTIVWREMIGETTVVQLYCIVREHRSSVIACGNGDQFAHAHACGTRTRDRELLTLLTF